MKSPAFRFYPDNFRDGVSDMEQHEIGSYIMLLCYQWNHGHIPKERARIERAALGPVSDHVLKKFKLCEDGELRNERLEIERQRQIEFSECQREKSALGNKARWGSSSPRRHPTGDAPGTPEGIPEGIPEASPSVSVSVSVSDSVSDPVFKERAAALGTVFRRRDSTPWSKKELQAFKVSALTAHADDFADVLAYYKSDAHYKRRDLQTLLNNWNGEVDRAKDWKRNPAGHQFHLNGTAAAPPSETLDELRKRALREAL